MLVFSAVSPRRPVPASSPHGVSLQKGLSMLEFRFNPECLKLGHQACGPLAFLLGPLAFLLGPLAFLFHRGGNPDAVRVIEA